MTQFSPVSHQVLNRMALLRWCHSALCRHMNGVNHQSKAAACEWKMWLLFSSRRQNIYKKGQSTFRPQASGLSPRSVLAILHIGTIPDALRHFWTIHTSFVRSGLSGPGIIGSHIETNTQSVIRKEKHCGINMSRTLGQRSGTLRHTSLALWATLSVHSLT